MQQVTVTSNNLGQVVVPGKNNPEYGYVRVEAKVQEIINGWLTPRKRSAIIRGKVIDLQGLGFVAGQKLEGKIVITESLTPSNPNDGLQDLKYAGETGVVCTFNDAAIYRTSEFTQDINAGDTFIAHTNADQIKAKQAEVKLAAGVVQPAQM